MAEWPTLEELETQLGISSPEGLPLERVTILERALSASIEQVRIDTVGLEPTDPETGEPYPPGSEPEPSESMAAAALLLAVRITKAPDAPFGVAAVFDSGGLYKAVNDPDYRRLLKGQRLRFGIA